MEDRASIELEDSEKPIDDKRKEEELEVLGSIGFKNAKEPYMKLNDAIKQIDSKCKEMCQKLYTGENAKWLVGADKVPEYLTAFLDQMKRQAEGFRIAQVRQLRTSALRLVDLSAEVPQSVLHFVRTKFEIIINEKVDTENGKFATAYEADKGVKDNHLRKFRPNLENPANKEATLKLNEEEQIRTKQFLECVDDS